MDTTDNILSSDQPYRHTLRNHRDDIAVAATVVLFVTAILGSLLSGPEIGSYQAFFFRLYLPFYVVGFAWYIWSTHTASRPLPMTVKLFATFAGWVLLSLLWAFGPGFGISWVFFIVAGMFVGGAVFVTAGDERTVWWYLVAIFALVALGEIVAFWEIFTGGHLHSSRLAGPFGPDEVRFGVDMASAWFGNRNNFAFFLGLAAGPLFAVGYRADISRVWRALSFLAILLAGVIMVSGGAWSALLSLAVTVVSIPALSALRSRFRSRSWTLPEHGAAILTALAFIAAIVIVAVIMIVPNPIGSYGSSFWDRWQLALAAMELVFETNGLGVGIGAFPAAMEATSVNTTGTLAPHNWLFYTLGTFGIVGTALFLAAFTHLLYDLFAAYIDTGSVLQLGLLGVLLPLPLSAIGPANALHTYTFWLFLALAAAATYRGST